MIKLAVYIEKWHNSVTDKHKKKHVAGVAFQFRNLHIEGLKVSL